MQPHLPAEDVTSGLGVLRLWAGNEHGFAMAPVCLPQQLLAAAGAAGTAAADAPAAPWIANLYVKVTYAVTGCRFLLWQQQLWHTYMHQVTHNSGMQTAV
jgi:hypothetical protein